MEVALFEALANAVIHGNREQPAKTVNISCRCEQRKCVSIVIRDQGGGFDPTANPGPNPSREPGSGARSRHSDDEDFHG